MARESTLTYYRYYCKEAGLTLEEAKTVLAECHRQASYRDLDVLIREAKKARSTGAAAKP